MVLMVVIMVVLLSVTTAVQTVTDVIAISWNNPCGQSGMVYDHRKNHNSSPEQSFNAYKDQLKITNVHVAKITAENKLLYTQANIYSKDLTNFYNWLPKYQQRNSSIISEKDLQQHHKDLQIQAAGIYYLLTLNAHSQTDFSMDKREQQLFTISNYLKMALCELETAMHANGIQVQNQIPFNYFEEKMGMKTVLSSSTEMKIRDSEILSKLDKYLRSWNQYLQQNPVNLNLRN